MNTSKTIIVTGILATAIILIFTIQYYNQQQVIAKSLADVGKALKHMFGGHGSNNNDNNNNNDNSGSSDNHNDHHKKSEKEQIRDENARLQQQIKEMQIIKSKNVVLPNGSTVVPPDLQRAMLNNTSILLKNVDTTQNSLSNFTTNNPMAKVGEAVKNMFKK